MGMQVVVQNLVEPWFAVSAEAVCAAVWTAPAQRQRRGAVAANKRDVSLGASVGGRGWFFGSGLAGASLSSSLGFVLWLLLLLLFLLLFLVLFLLVVASRRGSGYVQAGWTGRQSGLGSWLVVQLQAVQFSAQRFRLLLTPLTPFGELSHWVTLGSRL
ncbi:Hypothetical_protein [Hexamita inflata]|uniref:Hypothetical_protein n=1 Tax=Hexamita inflata TaxID=28002 RepID=A0AA86UH52_9EUKA|nr:Hypothetical protein HINF_LOCUS17793 [Hexamita inflata]CAI9957955.1 Hypothetical protein HINF_LOCUS45600 [Hexamita inflata]